MSRRVIALCSLLLAIAAVEFTVLAGAFPHVDLAGGAQPAYAGVAITNTPTGTGTPSLTATPTATSTPISPPGATATATSTPAGYGTITGVITNTLGTPIAGADVASFPDGSCCIPDATATSAANGTYALTNVPASAHNVQASAPGYVARYYGGAYQDYEAAAVNVAPNATSPNINITLEHPITISGKVTNALATPIAGAYVSVEPLYVGAITDANGDYVIDFLPPGSYRVRAQSAGYVTEYYNGVYDYYYATLVTLGDGGAQSNVNFALSTGGTISGVVRDSSLNPIAGAQVYANGQTCCSSYGSDTSGVDGSYQITALAPDSYRVSASAGGFAGAYYDGVYDYSAATLVPVTDGANTSGVDFALEDEAIINGFVRDDANQPVAGAYVSVANNYCCSGSDVTGVDGSYQLTGLPPGNVRVGAQAQAYLSEYYNNSPTYAGATDIPLVAGGVTNGINFSLTLGGVITGVVRDAANQPLAGASVYASPLSCCAYGDSGYTAGDGSYRIEGLSAGAHRVSASKSGFIQEYYDNVLLSADASPVAVSLGATTSGIDFSLEEGAHISGTVTDGNGQPLAGVDVYTEVFDNCCEPGQVGSASTDGAGHYDISGLLPGDFRVRADKDGYIGEYYNNQAEFSDATPVVVTGTSTTSGIDFSLAIGAHITGVVKDAANQPIAGVSVSAGSSVCCSEGSYGYAYTDANGAYDINGLAAGTFIVDARKTGYPREYYNNVYTRSTATGVVVAAAATVANINFSLELGGSVTGTVRDQSAVPIAGASIELRLQPGGDVIAYGYSGADGTYTATDLPPGNYKVSASKWNLFVTEYYNNVEDPAAATLVPVTKNVTTPGIDFSLRPPNPDKWRETIDFFNVYYTRSLSTTGFGIEAGETQPCGTIGGTAWFKHAVQSYPVLLPIGAPPNQVSFPNNPITMQADTGGSDFDTVLAVYDDPNPSPPSGPVGAPLLLMCNDDAAGGSQSVLGAPLAAGKSKVTWNAIPGHSYIIQAGGKNGATGNLVLNVGCPGDGDCDAAANAGDNCPTVWNYDQKNTDNEPLTTPGNVPVDTTLANSDGLGDACDPDIDNDGLSNDDEDGFGAVSPPGACASASAQTNYLKSDTDGDRVIDGAECALGSDPNNAASKPVVGGPDSDNDGLSNAFEAIIGSNPNDTDSDDDKILDGIEYKGYGTSLTDTNTDGDACSDGREVASVDGLSAVNSIDLQLVARNFSQTNKPAMDVNKDGNVNSLDLQLVARNFAPGGC